MKRYWIVSTVLSFGVWTAEATELKVVSPNQKTAVTISQQADGNPVYSISRAGDVVVEPSGLGFELVGEGENLTAVTVKELSRATHDETWQTVWGEQENVRERYNEFVAEIEEVRNGTQTRVYDLRVRVFDDGVGFRYEFPEQEGLNYFIIADEKTEFKIKGCEHVWWIPAHSEGSYYESLYRKTSPGAVRDTMATPVVMEMKNGRYVALHEAALEDYASMTLRQENGTLRCELVPWSNGVKVYARTPFKTPWRTIVMADNLAELVGSTMMLNLNEPCKIEDTGWIKPMKYVGIWWGMHLRKYTWDMGERHGATTENAKAYVDFAAKNGIGGVLAEGWNEGWAGFNGNLFNYTRAYADFDLAEVARYAQAKGVAFVGHHETYGAVRNYERQMDEAFDLYERLGIHAVKTGYVMPRFDGVEYHDGQYGVRHYNKVMREAAARQIMVDVHEPIKQTGLCRTYPNLMAAEGARGQEFNAWSGDGGNPPSHQCTLPFTRLLAGPLDYTPGVFNFAQNEGLPARVKTTLAAQLALYVVLYSPLQMACDLPENYKGKAFDFIKDVPTTWTESRLLDGKIGEYVLYARKDRASEDWYVGGIAGETGREMTIPLDFLEKGVTYKAEIYGDVKGQDYARNPQDYRYTERKVKRGDVLKYTLAAGGGVAIRLIKTENKK